MADHGVATEPDPNDSASFSFSAPSGMTPDQAAEIGQSCQASVGEIPYASLTDAQLKAGYDARVDQLACLVAHGFTTDATPISYDVYLSRYKRSKGKDLWEPTDGLGRIVVNGKPEGPSNKCPRVGTAW
ncbi:hypothetical protein QT381_13925 [Galbitalea sp. SE-J8]|uniref:hypothetical protein n=1 Tax=Galbitalea sp. SE-J8 TaxID=3054952 RepID=UPI00259CEFFC|nr:hypothetical protein [Galbitalea sp. SE-J8]MDM4764105.1 hypothetical protein [Galbitalea sp. SE-J8]